MGTLSGKQLNLVPIFMFCWEDLLLVWSIFWNELTSSARTKKLDLVTFFYTYLAGFTSKSFHSITFERICTENKNVSRLTWTS